MSGCVAESGWRHPGLGSGPRHLGRSNEPRTALCWQNVAHSRDCENEATQPDWTAGCAARCLSGVGGAGGKPVSQKIHGALILPHTQYVPILGSERMPMAGAHSVGPVAADE